MTAGIPPHALRFVPVENLSTDYANLVRVTHSPLELTFEFARLLPGEDHAEVLERIVMSPLGAKLLLRALSENLNRFETAFGEITVPASSNLVDQLFKPGGPPPGSGDKE
jgi:hypothetical protein